MNLKDYIKDYGYMVKRDTEMTLSSGKKSNLYFDMKGLMLDGRGATLVSKEFSDLLARKLGYKQEYVLCGMELGGAQLVQLMVQRGYYGVIVRKKEKEYGLKKRIEGELMENVVIVDDVITSGNTVEEVKKILSGSCNILRTVCIIDRTEDQRYESLYKEKDFEDT